MFYAYVLRSAVDDKLYIGCTADLRKRLEEHNSGKVEVTQYRVPLKLIYYEACLNKNNVFKREKYFKTGYGRGFLASRI